MDLDTTINLFGGVYDVGATTVTIGNGTEWCQLKAMAGQRPILTATNGMAPNVVISVNTTVTGVWFGGKKDLTLLDIHTENTWATVSGRAGDTLINCVFFGYFNDGFGAAQYPVVIKNCLFASVGFKYIKPNQNENILFHGIYFSGEPSTIDSGYIVKRNVFVGNRGDTLRSNDTTFCFNGSYAIQFWHGPDYGTVTKNWTSGTSFELAIGSDGDAAPADTARHYIVRDNFFWGGTNIRVNPLSFNMSRTTHINWKHNVFGPMRLYLFVPPGGGQILASTGTSVDSNYECNLYGGTDAYPNGQAVTATWQFTSSQLFASTPVVLDTATARLARAFWSNKTSADVYADSTNILSNWQTLLNAVDAWQGTTEEAVYTDPIRYKMPWSTN
jgi:hypothetical protein